MFREWTDPQTGELFEVVWAGDYDVPITGDRLTKTSPVFDTPKGGSYPTHDISWDGDPKTGPSAAEVIAASGGKRVYNKSGRYAKDPDFWKVSYDEPDSNPEPRSSSA